MTIGASLARGRERLRAFGDEGRFDALRLLEDIADLSAATIFAFPERELEHAAATRYANALERRVAGEPIAYIVGRTGFCGRTFAVSSAVLVPRPESEALVALTAAYVTDRSREAAPPRICDVGTGSGALAISIACEIPGADIVAIDVSLEALAVARRNADEHGVAARVRFVRGDLLAALDAVTVSAPAFDCIVANLPYVETAALEPAPAATAFEPRLALDGGADGLDVYRRFLMQVPRYVRPGTLLLMEAGAATTGTLADLAEAAFGDAAIVRTHRDYGLRERIVDVRFEPTRSLLSSRD